MTTSGNMRLIVDSDGSVWSAYDEKLVERWGYPDPDFDLRSFAVRNLGAIDIEVEEARATITFRWLTVKTEALMGAVQLLGQLPPREVVVRCETNVWTDQTFEDPEKAVGWIKANQALWAGGGGKRSVVTMPRQLNALSDRPLSRIEGGDDSLALMFKKWRLTQGRFSEDVVNFMVRFNMLDRAVITRQGSGEDIVFEHIGQAITLYDRADDAWTFNFAGRPVRDQPDAEYGKYTEMAFRDVLTRSEPKFDHVDAVVRHGQGAGRFQYDRLLLPWQLHSGDRVLTSLSFKTNPDSLPVA